MRRAKLCTRPKHAGLKCFAHLLLERLVPVVRLPEREFRLMQPTRERVCVVFGLARGRAKGCCLSLVSFDKPDALGLGLARKCLLGCHCSLLGLSRQIGVASL